MLARPRGRIENEYWMRGFPNEYFCDSWVVGFGGPTMLTTMTEEDWAIVLKAFAASPSRRGEKDTKDDRMFSKPSLFCGSQHHLARASAQFGHWNSVWKRFGVDGRVPSKPSSRRSRRERDGASVQMFNSTVVRAHVSAAGAKGAKKSGARSLARRIFDENSHED